MFKLCLIPGRQLTNVIAQYSLKAVVHRPPAGMQHFALQVCCTSGHFGFSRICRLLLLLLPAVQQVAYEVPRQQECQACDTCQLCVKEGASFVHNIHSVAFSTGAGDQSCRCWLLLVQGLPGSVCKQPLEIGSPSRAATAQMCHKTGYEFDCDGQE